MFKECWHQSSHKSWTVQNQVSKASTQQFQCMSVVLLPHSFMRRGMLNNARWKLDACHSQFGFYYKGGPLKYTHRDLEALGSMTKSATDFHTWSISLLYFRFSFYRDKWMRVQPMPERWAMYGPGGQLHLCVCGAIHRTTLWNRCPDFITAWQQSPPHNARLSQWRKSSLCTSFSTLMLLSGFLLKPSPVLDLFSCSAALGCTEAPYSSPL